MKIIKKPNIPIVVCEKCGCEFQPKYRNIKRHYWSCCKEEVKCPFCKKHNIVRYKEN